MDTYRGSIIIACAAAFLIVTVTVNVVSSENEEKPVFVRCDNFTGEIQKIEISQCPNIAAVGYCLIYRDSYTIIGWEFTPSKW